MSKIFRLSALSSLILLSACGGGGGGKKNDDNNLPVSREFSVQSVITNSCGVESAFTDVELVLQDENWLVVDTYFPDETGLITLTTDQAKINYTIIAKTKNGDDDEGIAALSYFQAESNRKGKYYATYDDKIDSSTCECVTQDVVLTHIPLSNVIGVTSSTPYEDHTVVDGSTTQFNNVTACKPVDQSWPEHSFSVYDDVDGYLGLHNDFSKSESGQWPVNDIGRGTYISISKNNPKLTTSQIFNNQRHFSVEVEQNSREAMIFENHKYVGDATFYGQAEHVFYEQTDSPKYYFSFKSSDTIYSTDYNNALDLKPSTNEQGIDWEYFKEITKSSYDYSKVDNHKMAIIRFDYDAKNPTTLLDMPASWTLYGPIEGTLPMVNGLPGYEDIIAADTDIDIFDVNLIRNYQTSNYQDYINEQVTTGNVSLEKQLDRKEQRIHQYLIKRKD